MLDVGLRVVFGFTQTQTVIHVFGFSSRQSCTNPNLIAVYVYVVPWSRFPIAPPYPHYLPCVGCGVWGIELGCGAQGWGLGFGGWVAV